MAGSAIIDDLQARGLLHDSTDLEVLRSRLDDAPVVVYCGFDPTADSLQVGNLVPLLLLRRFQQHGHRPIALAGGATGMIGDPSGRSDERNLLDAETLSRNVSAISGQLERLLDFTPGPSQAVLVDNRDWTEPVSVLEFLRDVGKHITVNQMLAKESVKARVASDSGISYTEFSYMLLQAFDFRWLHEHHHCELQVGGSDQWGNITAGIDLVRKATGASVHGLTVPLLTDSNGQKLGKTAGGAVWLAPEKTTPDAFYQYWVNQADADVERCLMALTLLPVDEIRAVMAGHAERPEQRLAQRRLAAEMTALVHGDEAAERAAGAARTFTTSAGTLAVDELEHLAGEIPTTRLGRGRLGADLVDLVVQTGLAKSKGEARRLLDQGGLYVNDAGQHETRPIVEADLLHDRFVLLRKGKKVRHLLVYDT